MRSKLIAFNIAFISLFIFNLMPNHTCLAQNASSEQIQQAQETALKEKQLQTKKDDSIKIFVKKIVIKGATCLTQKDIYSVIKLFQNKWLKKDDINQIADLISSLYMQKGFLDKPADISFKFVNFVLEVEIKE